MLFKQNILDGIREGRVTVAFRRWKRPTVKAGGSLNTAVGLLHIQSVEWIDETQITSAAARKAGYESVSDLLASLGSRAGDLCRIKFKRVGDDPRIALRVNDSLSSDEISRLRGRLDRLDARSKLGPWTIKILRLIGANPEQRAADLARRSGHEKEWLKLQVRKLKNLGLTESLEVGYRLSPRGSAFLKTIGAR